MGTIRANAHPTKRFFVDSLTRDLTLEDAILDLADNSIDSFVRTRSVDVSPSILRLPTIAPTSTMHPHAPDISIAIDPASFMISDRCGGIDIEHAKSDIFRFGREPTLPPSSLGVFGIGMKRAMFKLGRQIHIASRTVNNGFTVKIDVDEWLQDKDNWTFPIVETEPAKVPEEAGTDIHITLLAPEVSLRIKDPSLPTRLADSISRTYALFLARHVSLALNKKAVPPFPLPIGMSDELTPGFRQLELNGVSVELVAGLAAREAGEWQADRAGWYVLCNGRVTVAADKTALAGWGVYGPSFHSKYRGFIGIAFFFSKDPASLPWTTTKRGIKPKRARRGTRSQGDGWCSRPGHCERRRREGPGAIRVEARPGPQTKRHHINSVQGPSGRTRACPAVSQGPGNERQRNWAAHVRLLPRNGVPRMSPRSSSSLRVPYDLRLAKQVERRMIVDVLQRLAVSGFPIRDYQYTGFGSIFYVDFVMFHKLLGISRLVSIEADISIERRARFNIPFACVHLVIGPAATVIPALDRDKRHLL
jgi:hypothetical protein